MKTPSETDFPTPPESDEADALTRLVADSAPLLLSYIDASHRLRFANHAFLEWIGHAPENVIGHPISEVIGESSYADVRGALDDALAGRVVTYERPITYLESVPRFVHTILIPDFDPKTHRPRGVIAVVTDITDRHDAERRLEDSEQRYRSLFEHNPDAIFSFDLSGRFTSVNPACETLSGFTPAELLKMTFASLLEPGDAARAVAHFQRAAAGETLQYDVVIRHRSGARKELNLTKMPVMVGGDIVGVYGIAKDVTAERTAQRARAQAQQELETLIAGARCLLWNAEVSDVPDYGLHWDVHFVNDAAAARHFDIEVGPDQSFAEAWYVSRLPDDRLRDDARAAVAIRAGENYTQEFRGRRRDGEIFWMQEDVQVTRTSPGHWHLIGVSIETTARRQAEADRARLIAQVQESAARERQFVRDVLLSVTDGRLRLCDTPSDLPARLAPLGGPIRLAAEGGLAELRQRVRSAASAQNFAPERWHDLLSAVGEAAMNALVHAGGGTAEVRGDGGDTLQVQITDSGAGISVERLPRATLEKGYTTAGTLGQGMKMMLQTADRIWLLTGVTGTTLVIEQARVSPPSTLI